MKTRSIIFCGVIALSLLFISSSLYAFGLGLYGTAAKGTTDWTFTNTNTSTNTEWERSSDVSKRGLGFTLDTTLAFDQLFNYRLQMGYTKIKIDMESGSDVKGNEYHLYNSFGFGVFRSEIVRVWLGPQIGFGWIKAERQDFPNGAVVNSNEFFSFYFSYGIIAGINFNIGDIITIAVDGGYRFNNQAGYYNWEYRIGGTTYYSDNDSTAKGKEAFVDVAFMCRIGDTF
jgi:hypothetical protein